MVDSGQEVLCRVHYSHPMKSSARVPTFGDTDLPLPPPEDHAHAERRRPPAKRRRDDDDAPAPKRARSNDDDTDSLGLLADVAHVISSAPAHNAVHMRTAAQAIVASIIGSVSSATEKRINDMFLAMQAVGQYDAWRTAGHMRELVEFFGMFSERFLPLLRNVFSGAIAEYLLKNVARSADVGMVVRVLAQHGALDAHPDGMIAARAHWTIAGTDRPRICGHVLRLGDEERASSLDNVDLHDCMVRLDGPNVSFEGARFYNCTIVIGVNAPYDGFLLHNSFLIRSTR